MYAIIEDSGTQIKVGKGDVVKIDLRPGQEQPETVVFDRVLLIGGAEPKIGTPYVQGATVKADVVSDEESQKVTIFKFRRRKNYRRKVGHRQPYLTVKVTDITA
jgi:large subunit ribosomal protein L21